MSYKLFSAARGALSCNKYVLNMLQMNIYILTLKHDNGTIRIKTSASSEEAAISKVMAAELCPRSAIKSIKYIKTL